MSTKVVFKTYHQDQLSLLPLSYDDLVSKNHPVRIVNNIIDNLGRLKQKAKNLLLSEEGIAHRKQRCWDVEAVFGNIKHNMNFKRFLLRGLDKVETEIGLIAMAHNLKKVSLAM